LAGNSTAANAEIHGLNLIWAARTPKLICRRPTGGVGYFNFFTGTLEFLSLCPYFSRHRWRQMVKQAAI
jgi:hypothetical protein